MSTVTVRFSGGPADGTIGELPAGPDGGPPDRWIVSRYAEPAGPVAMVDHLYQRDGLADETGVWTMRYLRSDRVGISE